MSNGLDTGGFTSVVHFVFLIARYQEVVRTKAAPTGMSVWAVSLSVCVSVSSRGAAAA